MPRGPPAGDSGERYKHKQLLSTSVTCFLRSLALWRSGRSARAGLPPTCTSLARRRSTLRLRLRQCLFRRRRARSIESRRESWRRCVRRATCSRGMAPRRNLTCPAVGKGFRYARPFRDRSGGGCVETRSVRLTPELIGHGGNSHAQSHLFDARACVPRLHMSFGRELFSLQQRWPIPARVPVKAAGRRFSPPPRDPPANRYPRTRWSEPIRISVVTTSRISVIGRLGPLAGFGRKRVGALADRAPPPRLPAGGAGPCARRLKRTVRAYCDRSSIFRPTSTNSSKRTIGVPRPPRGPLASIRFIAAVKRGR